MGRGRIGVEQYSIYRGLGEKRLPRSWHDDGGLLDDSDLWRTPYDARGTAALISSAWPSVAIKLQY